MDTSQEAEPLSLAYQLKVTLKRSKPPVWRRLQVTGGTTLYKLHLVLQTVMGWSNYHLYEFRIGSTCYGDPNTDFDDLDIRNAKRVKLGQVIPVPGAKFLYVYDFGDDWEHEIVLEKVLPPQEGVSYPVCLAGKRSCPPEDCGGVWGYAQLLETLADPEDEEYQEMLDWLGGEFDPEAFDLKGINQELECYRRDRRLKKRLARDH